MSLYHIVFLLLLAGAVWEHYQSRTPKGLFWLAFLALTAMLCFRFGQGTDYFSYAAIYHTVPGNLQQSLTAPVHAEVGWRLLCGIFRTANAPFPVFIGVLSVYMMVLFLRFVFAYGGNRKFLALLLCYHTLYLTYFFSVLRQGVVAVTFIGLMLPWLLKRDYLKYYLCAAVLVTIHSAALVLVILPLFMGIQLKFKQLVALVLLGFFAGVALSAVDIGVFLSRYLSIHYLGESDVSIVAVLERIGTFAVVAFCYYIYLDGEEPNQRSNWFVLFKIYAISVCLYNILMWSALISSRTVYFFKLAEIVLLCNCIIGSKKSRTLIFSFCVALTALLYVKNIDSYLEQGAYRNASVVDYPYVSIFNQEEIMDYRSDLFGYPFPERKR